MGTKRSISSYHNNVSDCPFCNSHRTELTLKRNRNEGRECNMYQVICRTCFARGPIVSYYEERGDSLDEVKAEAISKWNNLFRNLLGDYITKRSGCNNG